jgi:hypothetical protein
MPGSQQFCLLQACNRLRKGTRGQFGVHVTTRQPKFPSASGRQAASALRQGTREHVVAGSVSREYCADIQFGPDAMHSAYIIPLSLTAQILPLGTISPPSVG